MTSAGRRNVSNVPAQALTMHEQPVRRGQARRWADRALADGGSDRPPAEVIDDLYVRAFGRPPTAVERDRALGFLADDGGPGDPDAWADLCHALLNVKEFIYLP